MQAKLTYFVFMIGDGSFLDPSPVLHKAWFTVAPCSLRIPIINVVLGPAYSTSAFDDWVA